MPWWARLIKASPALFFAFTQFRGCKKNGQRMQFVAACAFLAAAAGDFVLGPNRAVRFLSGLACFLIAHVLFTVAMALSPREQPAPSVFGGAASDPTVPIRPPSMSPALRDVYQHRMSITVFWAVLIGFHSWLMLYLDTLLVPVTLYLFAIAAMGSVALSKNGPSRKFFIWGALLFVSSDMMIAVDKFVQPLPFRGPLIMLSYYGAIFCLSRGFQMLFSGLKKDAV